MITEGKLKGLAVQRDLIETTLVQLSSCLHFLRESLKTDNERYLLRMKINTMEKIEDLTTPLQADTLKPSAAADVTFTATTTSSLTKMCKKYGKIFIPDFLPDPSKCHCTGKGLKWR